MKLLCICLFVVGIARPAASQHPQNHSGKPASETSFRPSHNYLWPTDATPYASASFGETRSGHFHAALDIKTWGRSGYKVVATRPGRLFRVAISADGYGNVVYLQHPDSSYSIYAHLLDFAPRIKQMVDSLRMRNYSFEIDTVLRDSDIHFDRGELIAYTGASGIGPPHLHFELRTPSNKPFNPLLTNLSIDDHRPPRLSSLAVEPLSADAMINGKKSIVTRRPARSENGYDFGTVNVQGTVGLAVDAFDQADHVSNVYAVYEIELHKDGEQLFKARADSFSYRETDQLLLDRVYTLLKNTGRGYQRLYRADGNTLPFYEHGSSRGRLDLEPGRHTLTITARDYFGNTTRGRLILNVSEKTTSRALRSTPVNFGFAPPSFHNSLPPIDAGELNDWYWADNWFSPRSSASFDTLWVEPQGMLFGGSYPVTVPSDTAIRLDYTYSTRLRTDQGEAVTLHRLYPDRKQTIYDDRGIAGVEFSRRALYDTLSAGITTSRDPNDELYRVHLFPDSYPLRDRSKITYRLPMEQALQKGWGLYHIDPRDGETDYIPTRQNGHILIGEIQNMGTYTARIDSTPPRISNPRRLHRADGTKRLTVYVSDQQTGVAPNSAVVYLNGVRGIPEYDAEHHRLSYYRPGYEYDPTQPVKLEVAISDRAGNRTTETFSLPAGD